MDKNISYHNKDILFKCLSELYKNQALSVYGFDFPVIKEMIPNEFPEVKADAKRADSIFMLEDGSILLLEYESNNRIAENHLKYIDYSFRIVNRFYKETKEIKQVHVAIIYSSEIEKASEYLNIGSVIIKSQAVFMKQHDGDMVFKTIEEKISNGESLYQDEILSFILVPLMKSKLDKKHVIRNAIELSKNITGELTQAEVIAGLLTVSDKFIDQQYANNVKEWLKLTKVGRLFEEEKQEAVKQALIQQAQILLEEEVDVEIIKKSYRIKR